MWKRISSKLRTAVQIVGVAIGMLLLAPVFEGRETACLSVPVFRKFLVLLKLPSLVLGFLLLLRIGIRPTASSLYVFTVVTPQDVIFFLSLYTVEVISMLHTLGRRNHHCGQQ